jgi:hypothetical protein
VTEGTPRDDLPLTHWVGLIRHDFRYHVLRRRHPVAFTRCLWRVVAHRDNIESCEDCGRRYPSWVASDALYVKVVGSRGGAFCHGCLTVKAEAIGLRPYWVPMVGEQRALFNYVGAFVEPGYDGPRCAFVDGAR